MNRRIMRGRNKHSMTHPFRPNQTIIFTLNILGQNRTFRAILDDAFPTEKPYDSKGAIYYVVAVIFIYGVSIVAMLIAATVRSRRQVLNLDKQVTSYLQNIDMIRQKGQAETIRRQSHHSLIVKLDSRGHYEQLPLITETKELSPKEKESYNFLKPLQFIENKAFSTGDINISPIIDEEEDIKDGTVHGPAKRRESIM